MGCRLCTSFLGLPRHVPPCSLFHKGIFASCRPRLLPGIRHFSTTFPFTSRVRVLLFVFGEVALLPCFFHPSLLSASPSRFPSTLIPRILLVPTKRRVFDPPFFFPELAGSYHLVLWEFSRSPWPFHYTPRFFFFPFLVPANFRFGITPRSLASPGRNNRFFFIVVTGFSPHAAALFFFQVFLTNPLPRRESPPRASFFQSPFDS